MNETLKDKVGRIIAYIKDEGNKKVIYSKIGSRLAYYDGKYTYDNIGRIVGQGNLLVLFIKDEIVLP